MPTILGVNLGGEFLGRVGCRTLEKQGRKISGRICRKNSRRNTRAIFRNKKSTPIRSAEARDQPPANPFCETLMFLGSFRQELSGNHALPSLRDVRDFDFSHAPSPIRPFEGICCLLKVTQTLVSDPGKANLPPAKNSNLYGSTPPPVTVYRCTFLASKPAVHLPFVLLYLCSSTPLICTVMHSSRKSLRN